MGLDTGDASGTKTKNIPGNRVIKILEQYRESAAYLTYHNHLNAFDYPPIFLLQEYQLMVKINSMQAVNNAVLMQLAVASTQNKEAGKQFSKTCKEMIGHGE